MNGSLVPHRGRLGFGVKSSGEIAMRRFDSGVESDVRGVVKRCACLLAFD